MAFDLKKSGAGPLKPELLRPSAPPPTNSGRSGMFAGIAAVAVVLLIGWFALSRSSGSLANSGAADSLTKNTVTNAAPSGNVSAASAPSVTTPDKTREVTGTASSSPSNKFESPRSSNGRTIPARFASGSTMVAAPDEAIISSVLARLSSSQSATITVVGHASSDGAADRNLTLSRQRAEAMKALLVMRGAPASRISAEGKGTSEPIAPNNTSQGRRLNRRVEIR